MRDHGVPGQGEGDRWRAVWKEDGVRRQCEAASEEKLAAKLARITERLTADAPNLERPGADLIAYYLSPGRHPANRPWSAKHADTQRRLCQRFVAPVIGTICCQDIKVADMQKAVNAAPTAGEGARLHRCLSAMVTAGIRGGYLTNPRLREVYWQAAGLRPAWQASVQGESAQFVDPAQIPAGADVARLGQALAGRRRGDLYELMVNTAAYSGLRQGELFALTADQITPSSRVIDVDRKVIEVAGALLTGLPKGCKRRKTIYPARTPQGYPLADKIQARIQAARAETQAGANPAGLIFPSPRGQYWRSSNFDRRVLAAAYRPADGATPAGPAPGPGTACGTCSASPPCSPGSLTPPTYPAWPGTPTSAPPWTCTSAPPPASSTAPAQPPHSQRAHRDLPSHSSAAILQTRRTTTTQVSRVVDSDLPGSVQQWRDEPLVADRAGPPGV